MVIYNYIPYRLALASSNFDHSAVGALALSTYSALGASPISGNRRGAGRPSDSLDAVGDFVGRRLRFSVRTSNLAGHAIRSVVAHDELEQNFARSLSDLARALTPARVIVSLESFLRSLSG